MIEGVKVTPLKQIVDERGKIMQMLRADDPVFVNFGEIYFSFIHPGVIKGWHLHRKMILNYAVPHGHIKFVLYDARVDSPTYKMIQELYLGPDNHCLVTVPPYVWNGFKGIGTETAIVANCASIPHDAGEIVRMDPFDPAIPYDWSLKHR
ncbi:dTDP-4-dehydrorhamnose 3,5-epimerase family protein [Paenibacillus beijingensis]|uniref:dTDP-4-dehydrorhamnose 3,5-epimerase n=1 Tax=Paenibacillus beijingensis TaxID=1126833 RepID=A0A0D5NH08_9BACL|nr:dTDP-4-dehydrorhamnose 3,5-epimerase family protein [Paenibacillus beijingensis]AJY74193.1 dTDP-4-dehydrorhamnose 3,5-epimerase [Paenibacillus beijingensis]